MALVSIGVGNHTLSADAAASLERCFLAGAPRTKINTSTRSEELQMLWYKNQGKPGFPKYAAHPSESKHVWRPDDPQDQGARALDVDEGSGLWVWLVAHGGPHGWHRPLKHEPWHWERDAARDKHKNAVPLPVAQEDDMAVFTVLVLTDAKKTDKDWTLGHADIGGELPQFDIPTNKAMSRTIRDDGDGQVVTMRRGFLATNIESVGHAWARLYGRGDGVPTYRLNRDEYIDAQRALSMTAAATAK
jgi:hypothetical protein